jgi:hypothetical protein
MRTAAVAGLVALLVLVAMVVREAGRQTAIAEAALHVGLVANTLEAGHQGREQARVRSTGARYIREEFRWEDIEPSQGRWRWATTDRLMVNATRRGLRVLPLLFTTPSWAHRSGILFPSDPATFGTFAGALARRYGPGGAFWRSHRRLDAALAPAWFELWNEPFLERFSSGGVDPARYAAMVQAAARSGRAANRRTRWLMAVDLDYDDRGGAEHSWIDALYDAAPNLNDSFDGVAVHPYTFLPPTATGRLDIRYRFDRIGAIADRLDEHDARAKPIWITELGWSTCTRRPDCVDEAAQARNIRDAFRLVRGEYRGRVRALFVYHLRDSGIRPRDDPQGYFGLIRSNGTRKPAWRVFHENAVR